MQQHQGRAAAGRFEVEPFAFSVDKSGMYFQVAAKKAFASRAA